MTTILSIRMIMNDSYVYTSLAMPKEPHSVTSFEPVADMAVVHHMLLFGCRGKEASMQKIRVGGGMFSTDGGKEEEAMETTKDVEPRGAICANEGEQEAVLFAWGKNAETLHMPQNVGFRVGGGEGKNTFNSLVLEVHYLDPNAKVDSDNDKRNGKSGVIVHVKKGFPISSAATLVWATGFNLPPQKEEVKVETTCVYDQPIALKAFGFRVHTHELGRKVTLERMVGGARNAGNLERKNKGVLLLERDPRLPQEFEQIAEKKLVIAPGDVLKTTCYFDTMSRTTVTSAGWGHANEMCNLYLMVHSEEPASLFCEGGGGAFYVSSGIRSSSEGGGRLGIAARPFATDLKISKSNPPLTVKTNIRDKEAFTIGQVGGVVVEPGGEFAWVFHRGPKIVWDEYSFDAETNKYVGSRTPIDVETILRIHLVTGAIDRKFGKDKHFMPHGISLSPDAKEVWVTDCGLHQVIAYNAITGAVLREFGTPMTPFRKTPNSEEEHQGRGEEEGFCKPTAVEILPDGSFFVADGYCNHRVAMYNDKHVYIGDAETRDDTQLNVPHALAISMDGTELAVADRENSRIVLFDIVGDADGAGDVSLREKAKIDVREYGLPYGLSSVKANDKQLAGYYIMTWNRKINEQSTVKILSAWPMGSIDLGNREDDMLDGNAIFDIASFDIEGGPENTQFPHGISAWSGAETTQTSRSRYFGGPLLRRNGINILLGYTRDSIDRSESNLIEWFLGVDVVDAESFASENSALVDFVESNANDDAYASDLAFIAVLMLFAFFVFHATLAGFNRVVSPVDKSN
jgi:DNA-binding beta-propeller fold protein YncE